MTPMFCAPEAVPRMTLTRPNVSTLHQVALPARSSPSAG